jgi:predicted CoA-binding protein
MSTTPEQLLRQARTIAVVGFSADPAKPSHGASTYLIRRGWNVVPVNPHLTEVLGLTAYATLADVPVPIDVVDVFRPSADTPEIARQAVAVGASALWLQLGITSAESRSIAEAAGMEYVEDLCAGALAERADLYPDVQPEG